MQPDDSEWQIPLTYTVQGGDWSDPKRIWLRSKSMTINETLGNDTWIVLNVNKTGLCAGIIFAIINFLNK